MRASLDPPLIGLIDVDAATLRSAAGIFWVGNTPGGIIGCGHGARDDGWRMSSVMVDCPK
jgi:hypothetical protein